MSGSASRAVVTGAAGFIGSHVAERLLQSGGNVVGIDDLSPYYARSLKNENLAALHAYPAFEFHETDLVTGDLQELLVDADVVFHLAAQPGVRTSWAEGFDVSVTKNIIATQRLLEACRASRARRVVYASSSSVYGDASDPPMREDGELRPLSPYGVTKLSGEHLCNVYAENWNIPTVSLRYFTVYGPRQRPDMATQRLIQAALTGETFRLFGDGRQQRDFTYVEDVVDATLRAGAAELDPSTVLNVAGGAVVSMNELVEAVEHVTGRGLRLERDPEQPGDVRLTQADCSRAGRLLGWDPSVGLEEGLRRQAIWLEARLKSEGSAG